MRPLEMTSAPARRIADTNGPAQVFSYSSTATALPGWTRSAASLQVVVVQQTGLDPREDGQVQRAVPVEVGHRRSCVAAVCLSLHHPQVEDLDDPAIDEVEQGPQPLSLELPIGELNRQVVDRTDVHRAHRRLLCS